MKNPLNDKISAEGLPSAENGPQFEERPDFIPPRDLVARKAYFLYLNEGTPGDQLSHWLLAEQQVVAEHSTIKTHGFHN